MDLQALAFGDETELVESSEGGQVRTVEHGWAFADGGVGTSRYSRWWAFELPSSGDLDVCPGTATPRLQHRHLGRAAYGFAVYRA